MNIEKMLAECRAHWEKTKPDAVFADYWLGWQASRESMVIDLPGAFESAPPYACYEGGWNDMRDEVKESIEAAGLKVAP